MDTDDPTQSILIGEVINQIAKMDIDAAMCTGHIAGILAGQEHELWQYARTHYARYILARPGN